MNVPDSIVAGFRRGRVSPGMTGHSSSFGTRIGRYELRSLLGAGAMAEVYLAIDPIVRREVALKVLAFRFRQSPDIVLRFEREARAMASVHHPNVVSIFEVGSDTGIPFIAMEHVPGTILRELIRKAPVPTEAIVDIGRQLAAGLAGVHRAGVVHRDLKPENVIVSPERFVKILDFGLSKPIEPGKRQALREPSTEDSLTLPGTILGTPQYMSPEQARGTRVDFRADQFALGAILYEMATGVPAFQRDTLPRTLAAVVETNPSELEGFQALAPRELQKVVGRLLSKRSEDRYPAMDDVVEALERVGRSFWGRKIAVGTTRLVGAVAAVLF